MISTDEVNFEGEGFEILNLDAVAESMNGDCLFFVICSKKLKEQVGEGYAAIQNLFGFPKFGKC